MDLLVLGRWSNRLMYLNLFSLVMTFVAAVFDNLFSIRLPNHVPNRAAIREERIKKTVINK